jgi:hypothetical protein
MSENDNRPGILRRSASDLLERKGDLLETKIYGTCKMLSAIWACCLLAYFLARPSNFLRMWPHEFGSLLSGWAAPLAALWVFATVLLQRAQLKAQSLQMEQTSEELRISVEQLEANARASRLAQLSKRMMHGALRFAKAGERIEFYVVRQGDQESARDLLGDYKTYSALFKANEATRVLALLGGGMRLLVGRIREDSVLHADCAVLEELCTELASLEAIVSEIQRLSGAMDFVNAGDGDPEKAALETFRKAAAEINGMLLAMLHDLREFDFPPPPATTAIAVASDPH